MGFMSTSSSALKTGMSKRRATRFRARACLIFASLLGATLSTSSLSRFSSADTDEADRLYADRASLSSARRAADLWTSALASRPKDFDVAWKLSRADYWLGGHVPEKERAEFF